MREQVPVVRRRYSGQVVEEHAKDVIAAEYRHTTARGVSGAQAPDPQLHSHVVITGAVREDDRIVAVASRPIFRSARELGAFYRSALADELVREGYAIEQAPARTAATSRSPASPASCARRSPAAPVRSPARRSASVPATAEHPNAASCATSRLRTAGPRS